MPRVPIVIILGATGTGKSKLAVQIAKKFGGEVIGADSMQVYKCLSISSNKITEKEKCGIPHHLIDICEPCDRFTVVDYRDRVLPLIDNIIKRNKLPIITGGSNYYLESILWNMLVKLRDEKTDLLGSSEIYFDKRDEEIDHKLGSFSTSSPSDEEETYGEIEFSIRESTVESFPSDLLKSIKTVLEQFKNSVRHLLGHVKIPFNLYSRIFYNSNDTSIDKLKEEQIMLNVPDLEMKLMSNYIGDYLDCLVKSLNKHEYMFLEKYEDIMTEHCLYFDLSTAIRLFDCNRDVELEENAKKLSVLKLSYDSEIFFTTVELFLKKITDMSKLRIRKISLLQLVDDHKMASFENNDLHDELRCFDPEMAKNTHPGNRRKVIRSLQVYITTGRTLSDTIKEQQRHGSSISGGSMRYPDSCVLWLQCDQDVLDKRIDLRIDEMVKHGLIEELTEFHKLYDHLKHSANLKLDYGMGAFQSIGLKEFNRYLILNEDDRNSSIGQEELNFCIGMMKLTTKRYSKYQRRWILNRLIRVPDDEKVPSIFSLDCTNIDQWKEMVEDRAYEIINAYLSDADMSSLLIKPIPKEQPHPDRFKDGEFYCNICNKLLIGVYQWEIHRNSKGHRRALYNGNKRKRNEQQMLMIEI